MSSMWTATSDLDYNGQFNREPPEEEPEPEDPAPPPELEEQWEAADQAFEASAPEWPSGPPDDTTPGPNPESEVA